jgi:hypothetical protein
VQIENDVVHLRTSLVQLFALLQLNFEEVVQIIELRRFGGAPNGYPFAALQAWIGEWNTLVLSLSIHNLFSTESRH